jgi:hypothetical protein
MVTYLTNAGTALMNSVLGDESTLHFTKIQFGNGENWSTNSTDAESDLRDEIAIATELQNPIDSAEVDFDTATDEYSDVVIDPDTGLALIKAQFTNASNDFDWHVTEIGIWAQDADDPSTEVLYAVSAVDVTKAAWIPNPAESVATFEFNIFVYVGDVADVTAVIAVEADKASAADLRAHIDNHGNPHVVTKFQVGLGNVPNVSTNDQRPYYTIAPELENIDGSTQTDSDGNPEGVETLATIFGKIKRAIDSFILHKDDTNNPHKVTAAQVNAAPVKHTHSAQDITSGVFKIERGGTGMNYGAKATMEVDKEGRSIGCWGYYEAPGGFLIQIGRLERKKGDTECTVNLARSYKDGRYIVVFPSESGSWSSVIKEEPDWYPPQKYSDHFVMKSNHIGSVHVATWITIGFV